MTKHKPASEMILAELVGETGDDALSGASGGVSTVEATLDLMNIPHGGRYLEVGCATGWQTVRAAHLRRDITAHGYDPQPASVAAASELAAAWNLTNAHFHQGDARALPYPSDSAHGVFAGNIAVFIPQRDREAFVLECKRICAPQGRIVAAPIYYPDETPDLAVLDAVETYIGAPIHRGGVQTWIDLYEGCGLRLVEHRAFRFAPPTPDGVAEYVAHVMDGDHNQRHRPERREELAEALLRMHTVFAKNNAFAGFSLLSFAKDHYYDTAGDLNPLLAVPA